MAGERLGEKVGLKEELISKACTIAMKAHKSSNKLYLSEKVRSSSGDIIFGFAGSWDVGDWFTSKPFGEAKIDNTFFPSLKTIGSNQAASVNAAFLRRFEALLANSSLKKEVEKAAAEKKQIVFTGHSSGAPMAVFAALWLLERRHQKDVFTPPQCITFGSPLIGDRIFSHALKREHWCKYFTHFIMRHDIVPRIGLAPLSSVETGLQAVLQYFNPKSPIFASGAIAAIVELPTFFLTVMKNASAVTSHTACRFMGCTNSLLDNVTDFIELSPYRPFGTYVFCTGNEKFVVVENPSTVFQILFYSLQLNSQADWVEVAQRSLQEHLLYEHELLGSSAMPSVAHLEQLEVLPLSSENMEESPVSAICTELDNLGLSARARLCVRAAGELELQRARNQTKITSNKSKIEDLLCKLEQYKADCQDRKVGYYDAFKMQKHPEDFNSNIRRLELAGIWDEIVEMLKRNELPDEFEGQKEWIEIGTRYRRLVEPLDIANYYRHLKNEDTGPYMDKARPSRYRYTQKWREHVEKTEPEPVPESCFWAEVEELRICTGNTFLSENVQQRIFSLERHVSRWHQIKLLSKDVFMSETTFAKWWKMLPIQHRSTSFISNLFQT